MGNESLQQQLEKYQTLIIALGVVMMVLAVGICVLVAFLRWRQKQRKEGAELGRIRGRQPDGPGGA